MIGIISIVSKTSISNSHLIEAMRGAMIHRGPDDAGVWLS